MTTDVCVIKKSDQKETSSSIYWLARLIFRISLVSVLIFLGVVGLIYYFWESTSQFQQDELVLFLSCFLVPQLLWHYFSLYTIQSEGVVRNRQSIWMSMCPNRILVSGLTITLAIMVFYWNFLFIPEKEYFYSIVFLIIILPQLFVRVWDLLTRRDSSAIAGLVASILVVLIVAEEMRYGIGFRYLTSQVQQAAQLQSKPGTPETWDIPIPDSPRWKRDGMAYYPELFKVLNETGFTVDKKTHLTLTPQAKKLLDMGIVPFNHYQGQAFSGIRILDRHNAPVYEYQHPNQFKNFEHISPFILKALLVWENDKLRQLVMPPKNDGDASDEPELNYLIEGPRMVKSVSEYLQYKVTGEGEFSGGSTLMTTLEKITNTPGGRTTSVTDKIRQMIGAGLHLYSDDASKGVKKALVDFLNTVPMAGGPKTYAGELYGFGASYYAWFGQSIDELNQQLRSNDRYARAQAFKNICTLIVSIRRPNQLKSDPDTINTQANILLKRLNQKDLLNSALYLKAKSMQPTWNPQGRLKQQIDYALHRESFSARNQYTHMVRQAVVKKSGQSEARKINLQSVDVMPVTIEMSTDATLEQNIRQVFDDMYTDVAQKSPFVHKNQNGLLNDLTLEELNNIEYGAMVLEIDEKRHWRVLANTDTQSNVVYNPASQGRFQWGSTAKLRVLVNYLTIIHDETLKLQAELKQSDSEVFKQYLKSAVSIKRRLSNYLQKNPDVSMDEVLNWAMSRRIPANPDEKFLTGESWHEFHNYQKSDDRKNPDLWQMTTESINLSFVRLMRDVVNYYIDELGYDKKRMLIDKKHPVRIKIIESAIAKEEQFYRDGFDWFVSSINEHLSETTKPDDKLIIQTARKLSKTIPESDDKTIKKYKPLASLLKRLTYYEKKWLLARVKGLEHTGLEKTHIGQERIIRQTSQWFRNNRNWLQKTVYTHMEREAFAKGVTPAWKKMGYPFNVSPTYAVVLGSSGDTPLSLLELAGTLLNDGILEKNISAIERIILAPGSEFETPFKNKRIQERIIPEDVARVASKAMEGVLHKGTAIFASRHPLMDYVKSSGAKTGTGDNRHNQVPVNRSAAVLSVLDNGEGQSKYAICITMSVTKGDIRRYQFTSKIPVRILSRIADHLTPIVTSKSMQEIKIELAARRSQQAKQHRLTLASNSHSLMKKRKAKVDYKAKEHHKVADKTNEEASQMMKSLF